MTTNRILKSVIGEYPYSGIDHSDRVAPDHPQLRYRELNATSPERVTEHTARLHEIANRWAELSAPDNCPALRAGIDGSLAALKCVSATNVAISDGETVLVERPGFSFPRTRRLEISDSVRRVESEWRALSSNERRIATFLALPGLMKLPFETVNYQDLGEIPAILGKLLSRCENLAGAELDWTKESLGQYRTIESAAIARAGARLMIIPAGTRARAYVPAQAFEPDPGLCAELERALGAKRLPEAEFFARLFEHAWREFADEGFVLLHRGDTLRSYALVSGCCFEYKSFVSLDSRGEPKVVEGDSPTLLSACGPYVDTSWRRKMDLIPFGPENKNVETIRGRVLMLERLPKLLRYAAAGRGPILKAVSYVLHRQVNHNTTEVYHGRMQAVPHDQWAPNMSRGVSGRIINPPHAMGGVGEMFRGLLDYGDEASQFRLWRERDGTYGFDEMRKFLAYKKTVEDYLAGEA